MRVALFEDIRRHGLIGENVSLGVGFEISEARAKAQKLTVSSGCLPVQM